MTAPALAEGFELLPAEAVIDRLLAENSAAVKNGSICISCSFQAEDMIVLDLLRKRLPEIPVLFLDTGYHFAETYAYRDRMAREWNLNVQNLAAGQFMVLNNLEIPARGRLLAAQTGEPEVELFERLKKRLDFAQVAAAAGIGAIENSERRFLIGDGLFRGEILNVQIPLPRHAVPISVGFCEVIAGIEEQDWNIRQPLAQQIEDDHVLRLETAGDADRALLHGCGVFRKQTIDRRLGGKRLEFLGERGRRHDFPLSGSEYVARHLRRTFMMRSTASSSVSSVMRTAKKESVPKIARTTCFWSVPSSSGQKTVM